jgi:hypothetical protein
MLKKRNFLALIFLLLGCGNHGVKHHQATPVGDDKTIAQISTEHTDTIIYDPIPDVKNLSDSLTVFFESSFHNDTVRILLSNTSVFKEIISTEDRVGLAASVAIDKKARSLEGSPKISIGVNHNRLIIIDRYKKYKFMYISKINGHVQVLLSNKPHFYK